MYKLLVCRRDLDMQEIMHHFQFNIMKVGKKGILVFAISKDVISIGCSYCPEICRTWNLVDAMPASLC